MGLVIDIILLLVIGIIVFYYSKKGIISASKNIISLILTVVLLACLQNVILEKLQDSTFGKNIENKVSARIEKEYSDKGLPVSGEDRAKEICKTLSLPSVLAGDIENSLAAVNEAKNNALAAIADAITNLILRVVALILLFVLVRITVFLVLKIAEGLFKLPGLKKVNATLGAIMGLINAIIFVYIACGVAGLIVPADEIESMVEIINSTWVLKTMYNHNLLFELFI